MPKLGRSTAKVSSVEDDIESQTSPSSPKSAGKRQRSEECQQRTGSALVVFDSELGRQKQTWRQETITCKLAIFVVGGSTSLAGLVLTMTALLDLIALAHTYQGECTIYGFEYPDGYPDTGYSMNPNPCPTQPQCLFEIRALVQGEGARSIRDFDMPFDIPRFSEAGGDHSLVPVSKELSCCPLSPGNCCDWFDLPSQQFCDKSVQAGCHQAPWPCYFDNMNGPSGSQTSMEVAGAAMHVGSKYRSLFAFFRGLTVLGAGLLISTFWFDKVRKVFRVFWRAGVHKLAARSDWLYICISERLPRALQTAGMLEFILERDSAVILQRATRRWLEKRRLEKEGKARSLAEAVQLAVRHKKMLLQQEKSEKSLEPQDPEDDPQEGRKTSKEDKRRRKRREENREFAKHPPPKGRNRKLLLDTGSLFTFKRFSRVRYVNQPWDLDRIEVALEEGGPRFGAFVGVEGLHPQTGQPQPPLVTRVLPASLAEQHGIKPGFMMLKVGRLEWPSFSAEDMVKELETGRRPLFLVLEAPAIGIAAGDNDGPVAPVRGARGVPTPPEAMPPPLPPEAAPLPPGEPPPRPRHSRTLPSEEVESGSDVQRRFSVPVSRPESLKSPQLRPRSAGAAVGDVSTWRLADRQRMEERIKKRPSSASSGGGPAGWQTRVDRSSSASRPGSAPMQRFQRPSSAASQVGGASSSRGRLRPTSASSAVGNGPSSRMRPTSAGGTRLASPGAESQPRRPSSATLARRQETARKDGVTTSVALGKMLGL